MNIRNENGVTLIALIITIIVMLIIAGIGIYAGQDSIKKAQLESLKTNMLLIKAKTKEYVEQVNFKAGPTNDQSKAEVARKEIYVDSGKLTKISDAPSEVQNEVGKLNLQNDKQNYYAPREALDNMGLNQVSTGEGNYYIISFDENNISVEIYNTSGYQNKYSLTEIDQL